MTALATIGHNNPPDPIDEAIAPFGDAITEAENWLDGSPVETEAQMQAVDAILAEIRQAGIAVEEAQKVATAPLHQAWKAEIARWKPTVEDLDRLKKGLAALVNPFKQKLAAEKEAAKRAAYEESARKEREARIALVEADAANIDAQRQAAELQAAALAAKQAASDANRDTVKGLRTVTHFEIADYSDLLRWMNKNAREELEAAAMEYVRRNHKDGVVRPGVRVWTTKEAY